MIELRATPGDAAAGAPAAAAELFLPDDGATARVGAALGRALRPGDAVMLAGPLGAGKTALARAAILARLADEGLVEDVPSPTFTLVQTYQTGAGEVWHADLYRLAGPAETIELGLEDAFAAAVVLVEWPDRLGPLLPARRLEVALAFPAGPGRLLRLNPVGGGWGPVLDAIAGAA